MKIAFITDTHLGARGGSVVFREYFRQYYRDVLFPELKQAGVELLVHGGDFFDSRSSISVADIDYVQNEFVQLVEELGIPVYIILGNHDTHYKNTNKINSLSIFKPYPLIHVVDEEVEVLDIGHGKKLVMCPWINPTNEGQLLDEIKQHESKENILIGHFDINGFKMHQKSILSSHGLDRSVFKGFGQVLSGHYHHASSIDGDCNIAYLGSLFYLTWDDHSDWRGYTTYDSETDSYNKVENEFSLFNEVHYKEALGFDDEQIKQNFENRIACIVVDEQFEKIEMKELQHKINKVNPISLSIKDYTVFETNEELDEAVDVDADDDKDMLYFVKKMMTDKPDASKVVDVFDKIHKSCVEKKKDVI